MVRGLVGCPDVGCAIVAESEEEEPVVGGVLNDRADFERGGLARACGFGFGVGGFGGEGVAGVPGERLRVELTQRQVELLDVDDD